MNVEQWFLAHLQSVNKLTICSTSPSGHTCIFIHKDEPDPTKALMQAICDVQIARGLDGTNGPVTVRRVTGIVAPGHEWFWSLTGEGGVCLASGYAATEEAARWCLALAHRASLP